MSIKLLTAADLMTSPPITIDRDETLRSAARLVIDRGIHCLLVPGLPGRSIGIITAKDIVLVLCDGEVELLDKLRVSDAMTSPAICVQQKVAIADCIRLMRMSGVRTVPVLDILEPVGLLSFGDVLRAAVSDPH